MDQSLPRESNVKGNANETMVGLIVRRIISDIIKPIDRQVRLSTNARSSSISALTNPKGIPPRVIHGPDGDVQGLELVNRPFHWQDLWVI